MRDTLARENEVFDVLAVPGENMEPVAIANFFLDKSDEEEDSLI